MARPLRRWNRTRVAGRPRVPQVAARESRCTPRARRRPRLSRRRPASASAVRLYRTASSPLRVVPHEQAPEPQRAPLAASRAGCRAGVEVVGAAVATHTAAGAVHVSQITGAQPTGRTPADPRPPSAMAPGPARLRSSVPRLLLLRRRPRRPRASERLRRALRRLGEEDVDMGLRLGRAGLRCGWPGPKATLLHLSHPDRLRRDNEALRRETEEEEDRFEAVDGLRELRSEIEGKGFASMGTGTCPRGPAAR